MSALQDILDRMYVDPALLEQLGEEQKQILFIKMREEQLRRWRVYEDEQAKQRAQQAAGASDGRRIQWLNGKDGEVWVWVMGDHPDDPTIEEILDEEAVHQARRLAENEVLAETMGVGVDGGGSTDIGKQQEREEELKRELMDIKLNGASPPPPAAEAPKANGSLPHVGRLLYTPFEPAAAKEPPQPAATAANGSAAAAVPQPAAAAANGSPASVGAPPKPPVPQRPPGLQRTAVKPAEEFVQATRSYPASAAPPAAKKPSKLPPPFPVLKTGFDIGGENVSRMAAEYVAPKAPAPSKTSTPRQAKVHGMDLWNVAPSAPKVRTAEPSNRVTNAVEHPASPSPRPASTLVSSYMQPKENGSSVKAPPPRPPQPATHAPDPLARLKTLLMSHPQQQPQPQPQLRARLASVDDEIEKRQSKILEQIKEQRERLAKEAELEEQRQRHDWEAQERKAREAEAQIKLIAQKAREQHRRSLRTSDTLLPIVNEAAGGGTSLKEAIRNLPRPPKPKSRAAILQWYRGVELPAGTGLDPKTRRPAHWFHGVISRVDSEQLLAAKAPGSFLVRVSERIWGYTVSYVVGGSVKHFLVEKVTDSGGGYQFLGTNQIVHPTLYELIQYHETAPITAAGKEILRHPVGQSDASRADYADLFD